MTFHILSFNLSLIRFVTKKREMRVEVRGMYGNLFLLAVSSREERVCISLSCNSCLSQALKFCDCPFSRFSSETFSRRKLALFRTRICCRIFRGRVRKFSQILQRSFDGLRFSAFSCTSSLLPVGGSFVIYFSLAMPKRMFF